MAGFYRKAGKVLKDLERSGSSLKSIVFQSKSADLRTKKKLYALLSKTLQNKDTIGKVITSCKLMEKEPKLLNSYHLCLVLLCDILYGKGLRCGGPLKFAILKHIHELKSCWETLKDSFPSSYPVLPKYARINGLKGSVEEVTGELEKEGFRLRSFDEICHCRCFGHAAGKEMKLCFCQDDVISEVLMFCQCTSLVNTRLYLQSSIIIQDKASCLPAHVLSPPCGSHVIDACAAPGNKTTHLSSIMENTGVIYAFDKDPSRCEILRNMVEKAGTKNVTVQKSDFLQVEPSRYGDVTHILVDPSCSGSGMYSRLSYDSTRTKDSTRLSQLSKFQCQMLNHALSFPSVQRVVYSTCSIHREENEYVVRNALLKNSSTFEIVHILPDWPSRGLPVFTKGESCIRTSAENKTGGFFVAMFQRCDNDVCGNQS